MILSISHVCINVRDMQESLDFYCGILGMKVVKETILSGKGMDETVRLDNVQARMIWVEAEDGSLVELLHFVNPPGQALEYRDNDFHIAHICFEVEDANKAYEQFLEKKVRVIRPPGAPIRGGVLDGYLSYHILDPNGVNLEIKQRAHKEG